MSEDYSNADAERDARAAIMVSEKMMPYLAGLDPGVQGSILADLVARWAAGHIAVDPADETLDEERTAELRDEILNQWSKAVRRLIPEVEGELIERWKTAKNPNR